MAALFLAGLAYSVSLRAFLAAFGAPTFWDVVLGVTFSPQFLTWVVLPAWLVFAVMDSSIRSRTDVLARAGSVRGAWWSALLSSCGIFATGALAVVLSLYAGASGLPLAGANHVSGGIRSALVEIGLDAPLAALLLELGVVLVTFVSMRMAVHAVYLARPSLRLAGAFASGLWVWVVLSGFVIPSGSIANAGRYLGALSALRTPSESIAPSAVLAGSLVVGYLCARERDRRLLGRSATVATLWLPLLVVSGISVALSIRAYRGTTDGLLPLAAQVFRGSFGSLVQALMLSLIFVGFAVTMKTTEAFNQRSHRELKLIRFGSVARWAFCALRRIAVRAFVLLAFVGTVFVVGVWLAYGATGDLDAGLIWLYSYQFFVNGFVQLVLYACVIAITTALWPTPEVGLLLMGFLVALSCVSVPIDWNPFSAASMARAEIGWSSVLAGTGSLVIASLLCVLTLALVYKVRPNQLLESLT